MKKIKLLTPILTTACVATTIVPIASCSKIEHITLSSLDKATQIGTKNGKYCYARYNLSLDNDTYKNGDISCKVVSDNKELFKVNPTINGYSLTLDVQYWKLEVGEVKFTVQFSNGSWTQDIELIMNIEELEPTADDYVARYTKIRNHVLANEQDWEKQSFKLSEGDYVSITSSEGSSTLKVKSDSIQDNVMTIESTQLQLKTHMLSTIKIDGTSWIPGYVESLGNDFYETPEQMKQEVEYMKLYGNPKFKVPDDGGLGATTHMEDEYEYDGVTYQIEILIDTLMNSSGYYVYDYRMYKSTNMTTGKTSITEHSLHISDYQKIA